MSIYMRRQTSTNVSQMGNMRPMNYRNPLESNILGFSESRPRRYEGHRAHGGHEGHRAHGGHGRNDAYRRGIEEGMYRQAMEDGVIPSDQCGCNENNGMFNNFGFNPMRERIAEDGFMIGRPTGAAKTMREVGMGFNLAEQFVNLMKLFSGNNQQT